MAERQRPAHRTSAVTPYLTILLFAGSPFLNFVAENVFEQYSALRLLGYFAVAFVLTVVGKEIVQPILFRGRPQAAAVYASLLVLTLFSFGATTAFAEGLWGEYHLRTWVGLILLVIVVGWPLARTTLAQRAAPVVGIAMLAVPLVEATVSWVGSPPSGVAEPRERLGEITNRRSVYFVLSDSYAREDVLLQFGFDNRPFLDSLRERGFYIAPGAHAKYQKTNLLLGSLFNLKALYTAATPHDKAAVSRRSVDAQNGKGRLFDFFIDNEYRTAVLAYKTNNCNPRIDLCSKRYRGWANMGELEANLLRMTPIIRLTDRLDFANQLPYADDLYGVIGHLDAPDSVFLYAHLYDVHPPFVYAPNCEKTYKGGVEFQTFAFEGEDGAHNYFDALRCSNSRILEAFDRIIEADPNAIIVFASDTGPNMNAHYWPRGAEASPEELFERYATISAWRLPEECADMVYPTVTPLNVFPIVIACLTGLSPNLLPDNPLHQGIRPDGVEGYLPVELDLSRGAGYDVGKRLRERGVLPLSRP
jgi:hypothetical protein